MKNMDSGQKWEPPRKVRNQLQIEVPLPLEEYPPEKPKSNYDMGEDITPGDSSPKDYNKGIEDEEEN